MRALQLAMLFLIQVPVSGVNAQTREVPSVRVRLDGIDIASGPHVAAPFGRGGLVLASSDGQLVFFDSVGRELRRLGRRGSGPGEFRAITSIVARGDSVRVLDPQTRRITSFVGISSTTTSIVAPSGRVLPFNPVALAFGGVLFAQSGPPNHPAIAAAGRLVVQADADGRLRDTLGALDVRDELLRVSLAGGRSEWQVAQPFVATDHFAVAPDGGTVALVRRVGASSHARDAEHTIEVWSSRGRRVLRVPAARIPLTDADVEAWLSEYAPIVSKLTGSDAAARRALAAALYRPSHHPSVRRVLLNADGTIWLLQSPRGAPHDRWTIVSTEGRVKGTIALPPGSRPLAVVGVHVWVRDEDDEGEPMLSRYRVPLTR
jgi:hypothetical protein